MAQRITVDPITRIEGHLRIDCEVENGSITNAWSSGQMWRGIELILQGLDPREAWLYTQRICGVCTTVHGLASVRAVENALELEIPKNAQYIRNLIVVAHGMFDHLTHFYQLSALDWVDIVSGLKADPNQAAKLAQSLSDWHRNSAQEFKSVQDKLKNFVSSGQLGVFGSGYWGHPAMRLTPEVNLMATVHYLQALEYQRKINKIVAILGSKTPHVQNLAVGGVSNPVDVNSPAPLTMERLNYIKSLIDEVQAFMKQVYLVDVGAIGGFYANWTQYGAGVTNYLSVPDLPTDTKGEEFMMPGGYIPGGDLESFQEIKSFRDSLFEENVKEAINHSWYEGDWNKRPYEEETKPNYTDFDENGKYSWVKAPNFKGEPAQVGPLAQVLAAYAAGHKPTKKYLQAALDVAGNIADMQIPISALHSTIGRHAARAVRAAVLTDTLPTLWQDLVDNLGKGDQETFNPPSFPQGEIRGFGFHEAPRGVLSHWVVIEDGVIRNYQCVVPSTWNAAPRSHKDEKGPYEASLVGNPMAEPDKPLEVLRTVHSFDPCLACAIHMHDEHRRDLVQVKAL
jgi:hydrogenase large subunit